jgi:hypothetical protein
MRAFFFFSIAPYVHDTFLSAHVAGDAGIRVNIPYEVDGKKGLYQCVADNRATALTR